MVDGCLVCEDAPTKKNPIATCIECGIRVHKLCYGIKYLAEKWKCSPCDSGATKSRSCQLCSEKGNPMKICALFTFGVTFSDKKKQWSRSIYLIFPRRKRINFVHFVIKGAKIDCI